MTRHIAMGLEKLGRAYCVECGRGPARVYLRHRLLCGVCWHRVLVLRAAQADR